MRKDRPWRGPCPTCGEKFQSYDPKTFCSMRCYHRSARFKEIRAEAAERQRRREGRLCLECGQQYEAKPSSPAKYCSKLCARKHFAERHDRWVANPQSLALPQAYDEFLMQDELPCLVEGCDWHGKGLAGHMNFTHGVSARQFKKLAGFNLNQGVVCAPTYQAMVDRPHIHEPSPHLRDVVRPLNQNRERSLQGRERAGKRLAERWALAADEVLSYICEQCGERFERTGLPRIARYCSPKCVAAAKVNRRDWQLTCACCGTAFAGNATQRRRVERGKPVVCSQACKQKRLHKLPKKSQKKPLPQRGPCPTCGKVFFKRGPPTTFCSNVCYVASDRFRPIADQLTERHQQEAAAHSPLSTSRGLTAPTPTI